MIVVTDTSPINYLCQIGHIDILPRLFGHVVVPRAVMAELPAPAAPHSVHEFIFNIPDWIDVRVPKTDDLSMDHLGFGERQAILLVRELQADLLIADDREARCAAQSRMIDVIGTLGTLKLAAAQRLLQLSSAIAALQSIGFYMSDELLRELLGD